MDVRYVLLAFIIVTLSITLLTYLFYRKKIKDWKKIGAVVTTAIIIAAGGTLLPLGDQPLSGDTIYEITSGSGNWEVPTGVTSIDILVVAGGGGSGCGITDTTRNGGGGGAGGLIWIENVTKLGDVYIEPGNEIAYSIGAGGATAVNQGSLGSTGSDTTFGNLTAKGGGGGGSVDTRDGVDGGSGGGAGSRGAAYGTGGDEIQTSQSGWSGTSGFGNDGADGAANTAGGGGGANAAGSGTTGGAGKDMSSYVGTDYGVSGVYSKGGNAHSDAANGAANSGNGGNAAATDGTTGGNGGSGIVVLRYTAATKYKHYATSSEGANWNDLPKAYDENLTTYAYTATNNATAYFNYTISVTNTTDVSFYFACIPQTKIWLSVYNGSAWLDIITGQQYAQSTLHNVSISDLPTISSIRINAPEASGIQNFRLYEIYLLSYDEQQEGYVPTKPIINFAGNLSDSGGPAYRPPESDVVLLEGGTVEAWRDGYYTNSSKQKEDWIYINCTIENATTVYLNWLNETTWTNWTYTFTERASNYWDINTSGTIKTCAGYNYSFNVVANSTGGSNSSVWEKVSHDGENLTRRYVQLNCSGTENISYRPFYLWNATYFGSSGYDKDRLQCDQGDGTAYDTGYMQSDSLTDTYQHRTCGALVWYWFNEPMSIPDDTEISNIYYHFWFDSGTSHDGDTNITAGVSRTMSPSSNKISEYKYLSRSDNVSGPLELMSGYSYLLVTHKIDLGTPLNFTDNDIYEFSPIIYGTGGTAFTRIDVFANKSAQSFIILNVPSNATLNSTDWSGTGGGVGDYDGDGLSCWEELYVYYTNPFLDDTDSDGATDWEEVYGGSDPNDYTDTKFPIYYEQTIRNDGVDYFIWLGSNESAWHVAQEIENFDESSEYIGIWDNGTWCDVHANWKKYYGDGSGSNFSIHTFDVVKVYLTDSGTQVINVTSNLNWNYTISRQYTWINSSENKGYNYSAYNNVSSTTLSDINASVTLQAGEALALWNKTTYAWNWFLPYFYEPVVNVPRWSVILSKVENNEVFNT